jgi:hypothetical protein
VVEKTRFAEEIEGFESDAEFLVEFPDEGVHVGFAFLEFSAGEFPETAEFAAMDPPRGEDLALLDDYRGYRALRPQKNSSMGKRKWARPTSIAT